MLGTTSASVAWTGRPSASAAFAAMMALRRKPNSRGHNGCLARRWTCPPVQSSYVWAATSGSSAVRAACNAAGTCSASRRCSGAAGAAASGSRTPGDFDAGGVGLSDPDVAFGGLSKSIHRGFKFDRVFPSDGLDPQTILDMDKMATMSLKLQDVPYPIMEKIVRLLTDFGQKKDLERYGRYLLKKMRSRSSAEVPRMLTSLFLPEQHDADGPLAKLRKNPAFKDLFDHTDVTSLDDDTMRRLSVANMEDNRHKLFQMSWSPESALAYLAHRYPAVWAANFRVMSELARRAPDFQPRSVLDYGAGPAPGLVVASQLWPAAIEQATAVEPSEHMAQIGKYLTADLRIPPVHWQRCLHDVNERYDLIIASYVQMEVRGQQSRDALIKRLWGRLTPRGVLVLIEQGTPTGFRFMHHTRELLITRVGPERFHFVAPCQHEGMCPVALTGREWCHFAQRVRRTPHRVYRKGNTKRFLEETKFSFLCIRQGAGPRTKYRSEAEAPTAHEKSYFWPRVMYPVLKAGGHALIDVCSAPQNFERLVTSRSKPHALGYRSSRKAMWGDLWRFPRRVCRPEARLYMTEQAREKLDRLAKIAWKTLKWEDSSQVYKEEEEREKQFYGH